MDGWTDERMNGWMNEWMNDELPVVNLFLYEAVQYQLSSSTPEGCPLLSVFHWY